MYCPPMEWESFCDLWILWAYPPGLGATAEGQLNRSRLNYQLPSGWIRILMLIFYFPSKKYLKSVVFILHTPWKPVKRDKRIWVEYPKDETLFVGPVPLQVVLYLCYRLHQGLRVSWISGVSTLTNRNLIQNLNLIQMLNCAYIIQSFHTHKS